MWSAFVSLLFTTLAASSLAAPSPLSTSSSTVTTLSGDNVNGGILIHVLRTEDLIADKFPSKPLLLERLSHMLIRVELGKQTVNVNGHHLPILPGSHRPLEMRVQLRQVQMLKMPSNSPLVPLRLSAPEVSNIADKYMSEGVVAAMLRVTQEPLAVEATRGDNTSIQAEAFKVTIAIKILQVDGLSLSETDLPPVDLLHLIAHPDPNDPTKVATFTTLAPEELTGHNPGMPARFDSHPASMINSAIDRTRASILSTLQSLGNALNGMAAATAAYVKGHHSRKPCHKRPHHPAHQAAKSIDFAATTAVAPKKHTPEMPVGRTSTVDSFRRKMKCITKMIAHSSIAILLLGLPLALVLMAFASSLSNIIRHRRESALSDDIPPTYMTVAVDEKLSDEEVVLLINSAHVDKA